ncbi:MAG: COX15/CtaA family protein [Anaerolineae bacterium]
MISSKRDGGAFRVWAFSTVALTLGLIVFGAVVRVTDSGLGCGSDWPLCNGTIFPPLDNVTAWIEWLHRLFAALIGVFGLAMLATAWRAYRRNNRVVLNMVALAAALFIVQSALGAFVVVFDLPPTFVTLHLGTSMLLLGALIASWVLAWVNPVPRARDQVTTLIYANAIFLLVIVLTGALVRGSGATLACTDWPLCNGAIFPTGQGQLALVHMFHRFAVLALGVSLLLMVVQIWRYRDGLPRQLAVGAFLLYLAQAGVGALYVLTVAGSFWGAAHVGMAAATWALLITLCIVEAVNVGDLKLQNHQSEVTWKQPSQATI